MVWANTAVLEAAGLDPTRPTTSIDDWFPALDAVKASGKTPLSVGTTWTQVNLLETVLMSDLGAEGYIGLWDGTTDWASPEVTAALEDFEKLISYTNSDRDGLDWPEATQLVIDGNAAFNVMGDWAVAAFEEPDKVRGTDFVDFPVPGSDDQFGFLADSFTLPVGAPNPDGAKAWLETIVQRRGPDGLQQGEGLDPGSYGRRPRRTSPSTSSRPSRPSARTPSSPRSPTALRPRSPCSTRSLTPPASSPPVRPTSLPTRPRWLTPSRSSPAHGR